MPEALPSTDFAGVPDAFQRLWTPHRMAYIQGEGKPRTTGSVRSAPHPAERMRTG